MATIKHFENLYKEDPRRITVKEFLALPKHKNIWVAEDLIPQGVTFLGGVPKSYKSYLALEIAKSLVRRKPVFGKFKVKGKYEVLICDRENHPILIRDRIKQLRLRRTDKVFWDIDQVSTADKAFQETLKLTIQETGTNFLIIDSFRRWHAGDENSSEEVAETFQFLSEIKQMGVSILVIHHLRKEPLFGKSDLDQMFRGSSDLIAYPDCILATKKIIEDQEVALKIEQVAIRQAEQLSPFTLAIKTEGRKIGFEFKATLPSELEKPAACSADINQLVEDKGSVARQELHDKLDSIYTRRLVDKSLRRLLEDGLIIRDPNIKVKHLFRKPNEQEQLQLLKQKEGEN